VLRSSVTRPVVRWPVVKRPVVRRPVVKWPVVKWAAAAVAAGLTLSACGTVRMGAAAIVGNQRISSGTLTAQAADLSAAYNADKKKKVQISYPVSQIPQQALSWLLRFRIRDALAQREGISVTPAQQQQAMAALNAEVKSSGFASLAVAGVSSGVPPDLLSDLATYQEVATLLVNRLDGGKAPTTTVGQDALNAKLVKAQCLASKSLGIEVNPQFGVFDYNQLAVVPAQPALSGTAPAASPSPSASSSPRPQLTPPC
jgi:hypothetical protein